MPDLEKVIEGLKELRVYVDSELHQIVSPDNWSVYSRLRDLIDETDNKAIALLRAQQPPTDEGIKNAIYCLQNPHDCLEDEVAESRKMAMVALMAREPINAIVVNSDPSGAGSWWYACGKCNMPIDPVDKFCRHCGKAVKWK